MATTTIDQINVLYHGKTQEFKTVSQAAHFLRLERIKVGQFYTIQAAVDLMVNDEVNQTLNLKGNKFLIMKKLVLLEAEFESSNA